MLQFETHAYEGDEWGRIADRAVVTRFQAKSDASARSRAGRLAKAINGPVDLARAGSADWADRYMTTANPSPHHSSGFRFERLD